MSLWGYQVASEVTHSSLSTFHYPTDCGPASFYPCLLLLDLSIAHRMILSVPNQKTTPLLKPSRHFPFLHNSENQLSWQLPIRPFTICSSTPLPLQSYSTPLAQFAKSPWHLHWSSKFLSDNHLRKMFPLLKCSSPWPPWLTTPLSVGRYSDTFSEILSLITLPLYPSIPLSWFTFFFFQST